MSAESDPLRYEKQRARDAAAAATPPLFVDFDERPDLVKMVEKGVHRGVATFTGARVERDVELCQSMVADIVLGLSKRAVARKYGVSRNTVAAMVIRLRQSGDLESVRQSNIRDLDEIIEMGLENWKQALVDGKIAPGQIPISVAVALDKRSQLDNGMVLGTGRSEQEVSADDVKRAWEEIKRVGPTVDSHSTGSPSNPKQIASVSPMDVPLDVSAVPPAAESAPLEVFRQVPGAPARTTTATHDPLPDASASGREGEGGGSLAARGGAPS